MAKQIVNLGANANDGSGDAARTAFSKINQNISELYDALGQDAVGNLLGAVPFARGGTGAKNQSDARTNLGLASSIGGTLGSAKNGDVVEIFSTVVLNTNSSGDATIPFPQSFPNACVLVVACVGNPGVGPIQVNDNSWTPTSFKIKGTPSSTYRINYVAFGK